MESTGVFSGLETAGALVTFFGRTETGTPPKITKSPAAIAQLPSTAEKTITFFRPVITLLPRCSVNRYVQLPVQALTGLN